MALITRCQNCINNQNKAYKKPIVQGLDITYDFTDYCEECNLYYFKDIKNNLISVAKLPNVLVDLTTTYFSGNHDIDKYFNLLNYRTTTDTIWGYGRLNGENLARENLALNFILNITSENDVMGMKLSKLFISDTSNQHNRRTLLLRYNILYIIDISNDDMILVFQKTRPMNGFIVYNKNKKVIKIIKSENMIEPFGYEINIKK